MCVVDVNRDNCNATRGNISDAVCVDFDSIDCEYVLPYLEDTSNIIGHKDFSIMQLNVRGLISKEDSLNRLLTHIKNKVNVIALNETWLRKDTQNKINLPGYNLEHKIRKGKKGGGVTLAISKSLKYR